MADQCPACGEEHGNRMHTADEGDPRLVPWKPLLDASGGYREGSHLLLIALKEEGHRTEMLLTGMDDPADQVDMMGRIVASILVESGDVNGGKIIHDVVENWRTVVRTIRQESQAKQN